MVSALDLSGCRSYLYCDDCHFQGSSLGHPDSADGGRGRLGLAGLAVNILGYSRPEGRHKHP